MQSPIETLASDFGKFLNTITYDNARGAADRCRGFSMGGLIVRAYLAGLQASGALTPPANPLVHNLVLIATPNFGSFLAGNYVTDIPTGTQSAEMIPGSSSLESGDVERARRRSRGVNAISIVATRARTFQSDGRHAGQRERRRRLSGQRLLGSSRSRRV